MAKKVALITVFSSVAEELRQTLARLFGKEIELRCYSYDAGQIKDFAEADLFVISIYQIYLTVRSLIPALARTIIANQTITEEQYRQIAELPAGTSVLVVNYSLEMTMDTVSLFHQLGLNHLDFVPCYPGIGDCPRLPVAVTPGERKHVPPWVERVIDLGNRVLDARTVIDIASALGLEHLLRQEQFVQYCRSVRMGSDSVTSLYNRTSILEGQLSSLLDVLDDGILIVENNGLVYAGNRKAREVLGLDTDFAGLRAVDLIPGIPFDQVLGSGAEVDYTLVKVRSRDLSVKVVPVIAKGETRGALAIINTFEEREKSQQLLRSQLLGKGHRGRYTFEDILTRDPGFQEVKGLAAKQARSEASVLILGETGTGKELFAHAIHNASRRHGRQFVTVNCAALTESLLESELFGYEEGAFTGARKGGKPGLFELAHKGTIFLDEIGEMNPGVQARFLRVLESGQAMRIGGDRLYYVDVRVIAATNQDLWDLVDQGRFRKDLFYRLNVLPIVIPPLRERRDDVLFLLDHLRRAAGAAFDLTPATARFLTGYPWHGNVRELKNLVDYLAHLDKRTIQEPDLAPILKRPAPAPWTGPAPAALVLDPFEPDQDNCLFILKCLDACRELRLRAGRRTLHRQAQAQGRFLTEAQIRTLLLRMDRSGLVELCAGRRGTAITSAGIRMLAQAEQGQYQP